MGEYAAHSEGIVNAEFLQGNDVRRCRGCGVVLPRTGKGKTFCKNACARRFTSNQLYPKAFQRRATVGISERTAYRLLQGHIGFRLLI